MKIEVTNNCDGRYPLLKDLNRGECAWIQAWKEGNGSFDVLVMITDYEGKKSYVCLSNGFTSPPGNVIMDYPAKRVKVKVVEDN